MADHPPMRRDLWASEAEPAEPSAPDREPLTAGPPDADEQNVIIRIPAQTLHERLRRMRLEVLLLIAEAALLALLGFWWWPLSLLSIVPLVFLARATLLGGPLDPISIRSGIRGEERVAELLSELDRDGYRTLHDVDIGRGNADHVVIGPTGVFVVETKRWRGRFHERKRGLMFNGRSSIEVVGQVTQAAKAVKHKLERDGIEVWVGAVVASTRARVDPSPLRLGHVVVVQAEDLPAYIRDRKATMDAATAARAAVAIARQNPD